MAWEREGDEGGAYAEPAPGPRVVHADPGACPFCGARVERGELVWRDYPVRWQPEGRRRWWQRERLAPGFFGFGRARVRAHRCRSCHHLWFDVRHLWSGRAAT